MPMGYLIFLKTDARLAYGLAWAHAEDDFETIQQAYLAGNALLSDVLGKKGYGIDFVTQFIGSERLLTKSIKNQPGIQIGPGAYSQGLNRYAELNPKKVLSKKLFPVTPKKMFLYAQLQLFVSSRGDYWIKNILGNKLIYKPVDEDEKGSTLSDLTAPKPKTETPIWQSTPTNP